MNVEPKDKVWRLMVFDVPDRLGGLMAKLGFRATKKNPTSWWRTYNPHAQNAREAAKATLEALIKAGLTSRRWDELAKLESSRSFASAPKPPAGYHLGSRGGINFAHHHRPSGNWRMRQKRKQAQ